MRGAGFGAGPATPFFEGLRFSKRSPTRCINWLVGEIAGGGDDDVIRGVPLAEPVVQSGALEGIDRFARAENGFAEGVAAPEIFGEELVNEVLGIVAGHFDFFEDHGFFARDFIGRKGRSENHVGDDVEGGGKVLVEHARVVADQLFRREGVEHAADAVGFARDILGGAAGGAFEDHVLDEVGDAVELDGLAARAVLQPYAHGDAADVRHRLSNDDEAVGQRRFVNGGWSRGFGHALL